MNILWADEDYHLAAAIQILHGKMLYRDVWYDKPPLTALVAVLFGAWPGWPLRIASTVIAAVSSAVAFRFASALWGRREGYWAAGLLAFSLIFYLPAATIPLEPDTLMILPHLAAVYLAWKQKPLLAGIVAGLAFAMNIKGLAVLLACLVFAPAAWPLAARRIPDPQRAASGVARLATRIFGVCRECLAVGTACTPARRRAIRRLRTP